MLSTISVVSARAQISAPVRDSQRTFRKDVHSWWDIKRANVVIQQRDYSCGAAALATVVRYYWGDYVTENQLIADLERMLSRDEIRDRIQNGLAMTDLRRLAVRQGYLSTTGRVSFKELTKSKVPLIIGVVVNGYDHFVVYRGFDGEWVYLADPTRGNTRVPANEFVRQWQKNLVLVVAKKGAKPRKWSPLTVPSREIRVGETNWQLLRSQIPSVISNPTSR